MQASTSTEPKPVTTVPFLDLAPVHDGLKARVLAEISDLIDAGAFTNGPEVAEFERAFATYVGTRHCIGLASGLDALRLSLLVSGSEPGAEAIVPAHTFVATLEAVTQAGCRPVVVDIRDDDYGMDASAAAAAIGPRTRFILPVHLYGQMADMRALGRVAGDRGIAIIEDACQAHGASRDGLRAGTSGLAAAFSFYPGKNLGAFGDAGALTTDDEELAAGVRALREHGQAAKYEHRWEGYTSRLDTIQALVLLHKLPHLDEWNDQRRAAARYYSTELAEIGDLRLPTVAPGSDPVWHLYVVRTERRERLAGFLRDRGIATGFHYPQAVHLAPAYAHLGYTPGDFPIAERLADEALSLPIFPGITEGQLFHVVSAIAEFFGRGG